MRSRWFFRFSRLIWKSRCRELCFICVAPIIRFNSIWDRCALQLLTSWSQSLRLIDLLKSKFSFSGRHLRRISDAIQRSRDARLWIVMYLKTISFSPRALEWPHVSQFDVVLQSYSADLVWRSFSESGISNFD
jgi:hypothetical protein